MDAESISSAAVDAKAQITEQNDELAVSLAGAETCRLRVGGTRAGTTSGMDRFAGRVDGIFDLADGVI